jgi:hypothetical protein
MQQRTLDALKALAEALTDDLDGISELEVYGGLPAQLADAVNDWIGE